MQQLIGRTTELARVAEQVHRLPTHGGSLVISGDAGIGKTSIAEAAVALAVSLGARTATMTATESETSLVYAALEHILHPFSAHIDGMRARPRNVLARAFGHTDGQTPDVFAVGVAMLEAIADVSTGPGLLLVVDDAQWVDDSTARVLSFVARRLSDDSALLLLLVRSGHASPLLGVGLPMLELGPLSAAAAHGVLTARRPSLTAHERASVQAQAVGNPLGLIELAPGFSDDDDQPLAVRLQSAFASRIRGVAQPTRTLLLAAALTGGDTLTELDNVGRVLGLDAEEVQTAHREFTESGAVTVRSGRTAFRHPLLRSAIVSAADDGEKRRVHAALALAIADQPERAVWHRGASVDGADEATAAAMESAAQRAACQGSIAVVFRAWTLAARLSTDGASRARRSVRAAQAAVELGRADRALAAIDDIDETTLDQADVIRCALVRLAADQHAAHPRELRGALAHGHSALDVGDIDTAVDLALIVGEHADAGGGAVLPGLSELGRRIVAALPDTDPRALAVLAASDPAKHAEQVTRAVLALDAAQLAERAELLVRVRFNVDADAVLARMQRRLLDSYRTRGRLRSIAFLQPTHAWNEICLADWPEALRAAEEGTRLAVELGLPRWGTGTLIAEGHVAALRGDGDLAEELIAESERGALAAGAHNVLTGVQLTKGTNALAQGRYDDAFAAFRRPFDPGDPSHHPMQSRWSLGDLAEAAAHLGRVDEIRDVFIQATGPSTTPWQTMAESYARPFLATGPAAVEAAFERALGGVVAAWPTYRTRLLLEYGVWLRRQRRSHEAKDRLRIARDLADALGLSPWSERARSELRALGADSPPRTAAAWETLSPQELAVAQLAARGLSNREIGERLFLSHRTVGSHLYRIFPKLGVTNRAQLATLTTALSPRSAD